LSAKRKQNAKPSPGSRPPADEQNLLRRGRTELRVKRRPNENAWELVHPRCALERSEDLEEVQQMLDAGEVDVAIDELRWLLNGCSDFVAAHRLLGELAMADGDLKLARAHFGYAYNIGVSALPPQGLPGPLPYRFPVNQGFFEAAKGLAWCLHELDKRERALGVLEQMLTCDPTDPLGVKAWQTQWKAEPNAPEANAEV
jgi:tetratricopeptide (TPR) repeat protein